MALFGKELVQMSSYISTSNVIMMSKGTWTADMWYLTAESGGWTISIVYYCLQVLNKISDASSKCENNKVILIRGCFVRRRD